ncbi:MAG: DHH family phosphoesterase [Desulfobacterales bacterium]|nr:DHH family phosphoesterase [Desulfobacterales bacterium]
MGQSAADKLKRFYKIFSGEDRVLVVINADPDAIASAMAVKRLLWRKVAGVTISNVNVISRPDNAAMIRLLGISITHVENIEIRRFSKFVIVDSQPNHHDLFSGFSFHVVIDHHPDTGIKSDFRDIRPDYGATASILTEYLRSARIKPSVKLATGLLYAIKTDTNSFARQTTMEDLRAFQFLFKHSNTHLARKIEYADLRFDYLKYFRNALSNLQLRRGRIFVHLDQVVNPDVCVLLADFFMRVNPVKWSIVSGFYDNKLIIILRNDGVRKNAGRIAKTAFSALGSAGGHRSMARAELPLETLADFLDTDDTKAVRKWIIKQIEHGPPKKARKPNDKKNGQS